MEQKGSIQNIRKAFQVVVEVRKELEPLLEAPEGKTEFEKDKQRKKLSDIKKQLKIASKFAVIEAQKMYKLFCCFVFGKVQM